MDVRPRYEWSDALAEDDRRGSQDDERDRQADQPPCVELKAPTVYLGRVGGLRQLVDEAPVEFGDLLRHCMVDQVGQGRTCQ